MGTQRNHNLTIDELSWGPFQGFTGIQQDVLVPVWECYRFRVSDLGNTTESGQIGENLTKRMATHF